MQRTLESFSNRKLTILDIMEVRDYFKYIEVITDVLSILRLYQEEISKKERKQWKSLLNHIS